MSTKSWSHGRGCECEKCVKRREYFKQYYEENKEKILQKNRKWMKKHRKYPRSSKESVYKKIIKTKKSKYGRSYFKLLGKKASARLIEIYGIDFVVANLRRGRGWTIPIDKETNIHQLDVLSRINKIMDQRDIG